MNYGLPYMGSKNRIAAKLIKHIPKAEAFVDIFAGGCAMTHAAMLSGNFTRFFANDISDAPRLFCDAIAGKYRNETRWISREDFFRLKDTDPYVRICWSFGNNQRCYMYAKEIESWKRALHYARVLGDTSKLAEFGIVSDGSRGDIIEHHDEYKRKYIQWWLSKQDYPPEELDALIARCKGDIAVHEEELRQYLLRALRASGLTRAEVGRRLGTQMADHYFGRSQWEFPTQEYYEQMQSFMPLLDQDYNELTGLHRLWQSLQRLQRLQSLQSLQRLESLQSLERLQSLQRLERLQRLQRLEISQNDYREFATPNNAVIYCDPPYKGTADYGTDFDHERFYQWCESQQQLTIISEYNMPEERFAEVVRVAHRSRLSGAANNAVTECLFVSRGQLGLYWRMMKETDMKKPKWQQLELFPE